MKEIEFEDIQGFVLSGYDDLMQSACYLLLQIKDAGNAKSWMDSMASKIDNEGKGLSSSQSHEPNNRVNLAFTPSGLKALGINEEVLKGFSSEFLDGLGKRSGQVGLTGDNAPVHWRWGDHQANGQQLHMVLLLFAADDQKLADLVTHYEAGLQKAGLHLIKKLDTLCGSKRPEDKEHFGFRDGIAQPAIEGTDGAKLTTPGNWIKPGEIILGYENENTPDLGPTITPGPAIPIDKDPSDILPRHLINNETKDFGRNGTYIVFKQFVQHVKPFWEFMTNAAEKEAGEESVEAGIKLASKMVGRWPSGVPLELSPDGDNVDLQEEDFDKFLYDTEDDQGSRCPFESHIRRTNPRNMLLKDKGLVHDVETSVETMKRHRIIRRGRVYGEPLADSFSPHDYLRKEDDGVDRGLMFLCVNAHLDRQYEYMQKKWITPVDKSPLFSGADPICGNQDVDVSGQQGDFTYHEQSDDCCVKGMSNFTTVVGGAYLFMPGIRAIKYIANLP
ncbi:MAG: Dyp-type peroxidase [Bacteroidota bacterium]